ncbi:MAG: fibronectin type III domain-containing protein [Pyrinomonadaceae bacterium]
MSRDLRTQYCGSIRVRSTFVLALVLTLFALCALLPPIPNEVFADNNSYTFQGEYTPPACGPKHEFTIGPGTRTIDVVASALPVNDIVLKLYYGDREVSRQDTGTSPEPIHYGTGSDLATGVYKVEVCPFEGQAILEPADYAVVVIVSEAPLPGTPPADALVLSPAPIDPGPAPRYQSHTPSAAQIEAGMSKNSQDEPNIGVNWSSGKVMLQALMQTLQVTFDDQTCPQTPPSTWKDVTPVSAQEGFDPILFSDHQTNRTFLSHLLLVGSASAYTDNDGTDWISTDGAGFGSGVDHQTLGGGRFHAPVPPLPGYPNAVYYCAQDIAFANCALSVDGGLSFGPAVPMYVLASPNTAIVGQCAGLHGHVKVGPDGTVYVPNAACVGPVNPNENGMAVSEDNGTTWTVRTVPGTAGGGSDPSVAVDDGGLLYMGFVNEDKFPSVAVSANKGRTWTNVYDVGAMVGVKNAVFPAMVAGSAGRAAMAFFGTTEEGSVHDFNSEGVWHVYVAHTYDGGAHWITVNATPNDPIQRGGLHLGGGSHIHRNLLDFFDADLDRFGRMTVGYADGCLGACVQSPDDARGNSFTAYGTIARQTGGRRLFFGSDPTQPTVPGAPRLTVTRNGSVSTLTWSQSEDGGSPITGYKIYRNADGPEQLIATLGGNSLRYVDGSGDASTNYTYRVSANNAVGTSCGTNAAISKALGDSCGADGLRVLDDASGDQIGAPLEGDMDIQWVSIGEPFIVDGSRKIVLKLKVANLASLKPNRMWRILWSYPDAPVAPNPSSTAFVGRYYIGMNVDSAGAATFEYGIAQTLSAVVANASPAERLGAADPESGFNPDGTITLVISADKVGGPGAGDLIGALVARSYSVAQDITLRGDSASDVASLGSTYALVGNASCGSTATCLEDDAAQLAYSSGWHQVADSDASGGHFRVNPNKNGSGSLKLMFDVAAGRTGAVVYHFAKSSKGGTADVYVDGVFKSQIAFNGNTGSLNDPVFGFDARFGGLPAGAHTFELRNVKGAAYVDRFCLESAASTSTSTMAAGPTTSALSALGPLGSLAQSVNAPAGTQSISAVASGAGVLRVILVDPTGANLATADAVGGVAVLNATVSRTGLYQVKVLNLGTNLTQTWMAATPFGAR